MHRLEVHGVVQGVGFRPYVYRLATALGLDGWVQNVSGHVVIDAAGDLRALAALLERLPLEAPPHASVRAIHVSRPAPAERGLPRPGSGFRVIHSVGRAGPSGEFPPDLATCADCLRELFDPADRRFRYPFVNCTNCGPRATIIDALPYDRSSTTMAAFEMCTACAAEYADPGNRRFHAEPIACPACGPRLAWLPPSPRPQSPLSPDCFGEAALAAAVELVGSGGILALKGLGGYQLVCDATASASVETLRWRKHRPRKPLAVMVADLEAADRLARLVPPERELLLSTARPIVLAEARSGTALAEGIHPGTDRLGLFLPYTPLHQLLLRDLDRPLVVTSGNRSDEPIAIADDDALDRLRPLADGFLLHDREIRARYDDSVTHVVAGRPAVLRRARGLAPAPLRLPVAAKRPLLAVGAQLKNTFALATGERVVLSSHVGDLSDQVTQEAFENGLGHLSRLTGISPEVVAHDLHPGYLSTQYAMRWPASRRIAVQHHHAHVASCAAEHGITGKFIGVAYDGLGLGDDGTLWGGEILLADLVSYQRFARFGRAPLPGGEAAVRRPARMALGYLLGGERLGSDGADPELVHSFTDRLPGREVEVVRRMVERGFNSPQASSAGRLFDAVGALLGLCENASYEAEAAILLESVVDPGGWRELPWRLIRSGDLWVYDPTPTLRAVLAGTNEGVPAAQLAAGFHASVVAVTLALCERAAGESGLRSVCLSGGVFQNRRLTGALREALRDAGFDVFVNEAVPANDGGISFGQAAVAAARTAAAKEES
ncbi:carbamoyltransferase HypF [Flindersiella endophytica]